MENPNGLVCFSNCYLLQEDGSLVNKDLWIDDRRGVIIDAQSAFYLRKERPNVIIDLGGNILSPGLIDAQINGAYNFDFSVYDGDDIAYRAGLDMISQRIVETGVTALLPTIITQDSSLYRILLRLLRPRSPEPTPEHPGGGATLLGWHSEGPFLAPTKRGAHDPSFLRSAPNGFKDVEDVYGADALAHTEDWLLSSDPAVGTAGVRMVTLAPELPGMIDRNVIGELTERGVRVAIGHSVSGADTAARSVRRGAVMITHLFNAMPQLHHRDPGIIGLLGASPATLVSSSKIHGVDVPKPESKNKKSAFEGSVEAVDVGGAEALDEQDTPPHTPIVAPESVERMLQGAEIGHKDATRPFYGMIVDGVHSHPNSVRLAYTSHKDGCVLVTDAMKILDPNMPDGTYDWRDGRRVTKEGVRLYIEGTDTLAGSVVTLDTCVRNFVRFTGCTLGEALKCATLNPARCLGIESRKGTLRPGADADLVVLDHDGNVQSTWVHGRRAWSRVGA